MPDLDDIETTLRDIALIVMNIAVAVCFSCLTIGVLLFTYYGITHYLVKGGC